MTGFHCAIPDCNRLSKVLAVLASTASLLLSSCSGHVPPCPFTGEPAYAASAGCFALVDERLLVVRMPNGAVSPPGGGARDGESAQCTAHRETWEETGLNLLPGELLRTFDTGFHLYRCDLHRASGRLNPILGWEVDEAFWLPLEEFDQVQWRFQGQGEQLRPFMQR